MKKLIKALTEKISVFLDHKTGIKIAIKLKETAPYEKNVFILDPNHHLWHEMSEVVQKDLFELIKFAKTQMFPVNINDILPLRVGVENFKKVGGTAFVPSSIVLAGVFYTWPFPIRQQVLAHELAHLLAPESEHNHHDFENTSKVLFHHLIKKTLENCKIENPLQGEWAVFKANGIKIIPEEDDLLPIQI